MDTTRHASTKPESSTPESSTPDAHPSAAAPDDSADGRTRQAALAVWAAFGSRDPDRIQSVLTDDVRWVAPAGNATQVALGQPDDLLTSADGIVAFLCRHFRRLFPDGVAIEFTSVLVQEQRVVFEQRMRGRLVNGRDYDNRYCWVFEMEGTRVRRIREYMDTLRGQRLIFGDETPRSLVPGDAT